MALSRTDIQQIRALQQKKVRAATGLFVAEGAKVVTELVASPLEVEAVFSTNADFLATLKGSFRKEIVSQKDLEKMSGLATPAETVGTARIPLPKAIDHTATMILALDGIRDPGNLGTIIRTAKWFGVDQIFCSTDCVDAYNPKVVQGAMGALFHSSIIYCDLVEAVSFARQKGYHAHAATLEGNSIYDAQFTSKNLLVIGSESHGVSDEVQAVCDSQLSIPNHEDVQRVESLNAAIATSIILAEMIRKTTAHG